MNIVLVRTMLSWNPSTWIKFLIRLKNKTYYDGAYLIQRAEGKLIVFENKQAILHNEWKRIKNPMRIVSLKQPLKDGVVNLTPKNLEKY